MESNRIQLMQSSCSLLVCVDGIWFWVVEQLLRVCRLPSQRHRAPFVIVFCFFAMSESVFPIAHLSPSTIEIIPIHDRLLHDWCLSRTQRRLELVRKNKGSAPACNGNVAAGGPIGGKSQQSIKSTEGEAISYKRDLSQQLADQRAKTKGVEARHLVHTSG